MSSPPKNANAIVTHSLTTYWPKMNAFPARSPQPKLTGLTAPAILSVQHARYLSRMLRADVKGVD